VSLKLTCMAQAHAVDEVQRERKHNEAEEEMNRRKNDGRKKKNVKNGN
jgi:hypothetical protein